MPARNARTGFTLVELSIVLVIIGLIVGGVLAGKALIQQAEIRAAASQLQQMETAYRTFQVKYGCIIGDCANATDFFGMNYYQVGSGCPPSGGVGNGNGNGDGFIDNGGYGGAWQCEPLQAAKSLTLSGLLPTAATTPCYTYAVVFKGIHDGCGYFYKDDVYSRGTPIKVNAMTWAQYRSSGGGQYDVGILSPVEARLIDEKIDDGKATTGKFRGLDAALPSGVGGIIVNSCYTSGTYNLNEDYTCRALYYFK